MGVTIAIFTGPLQVGDNSIKGVTILQIPAAQGPSFNTKSVSTNTNSQY